MFVPTNDDFLCGLDICRVINTFCVFVSACCTVQAQRVVLNFVCVCVCVCVRKLQGLIVN